MIVRSVRTVRAFVRSPNSNLIIVTSPPHPEASPLGRSQSIRLSFADTTARMTAGTFVAKYSNDPSSAREVRGDTLLNKLLSLIKIFRPTPGVLHLPGDGNSSSKNSGRLIPDNCYHGHGLCGARLQITATSCLHPAHHRHRPARQTLSQRVSVLSVPTATRPVKPCSQLRLQ